MGPEKKFLPPLILIATAIIFLLNARETHASYVGWYGAALCKDMDNYNCVSFSKTVVEKEVRTAEGARTVRTLADPEWEQAFPDERERLLVMKLNRMNQDLRADYKIAVPKNISGKTLMDFSPFPDRIEPHGEKVLVFDPALYGWAAYDQHGKLVRWGPAVGGKGGFWTPAGSYRIYSIGDAGCRSRQYPEGCTGKRCTPMPYCMSFRRGYAFHAGDMPGRHESHGCVRLFLDDAKWLNKQFVNYGTKVIVRPYY